MYCGMYVRTVSPIKKTVMLVIFWVTFFSDSLYIHICVPVCLCAYVQVGGTERGQAQRLRDT